MAAIEQKNRVSQDVKPPSRQKKLQQQAQWQPKLNNMQGGNKGSKGINQVWVPHLVDAFEAVWVAKEEKGSTENGAENGRKGKTKGKGNNTTEQSVMFFSLPLVFLFLPCPNGPFSSLATHNNGG